MQRNEYLDDLGLAIEDYGTNFLSESNTSRSEKWARQREKYGFDEREIYGLDYTFIEWLYSHCRMYKDKAGNIIDLNFWRFAHNGNVYTQGEAIDYIIKCTGDFLSRDRNELSTESDRYNAALDACRLWVEIMPQMWF